MKRAVFVDKDGTLVRDVPYNVDPDRLVFMPHACDALRRLAGAGFALILATNQSGIERGLFSAAQFAQLQRALQQRLQQHGVQLLDVAVCPHAPDAAGQPRCACRKPRPGLLQDAALRHGIDLAGSWMVGDTLDDVEAGQRAGCRGVLFDSGGETLWQSGPCRQPHAICTDWRDLADLVLASAWRSPARAGAAA